MITIGVKKSCGRSDSNFPMTAGPPVDAPIAISRISFNFVSLTKKLTELLWGHDLVTIPRPSWKGTIAEKIRMELVIDESKTLKTPRIEIETRSKLAASNR